MPQSFDIKLRFEANMLDGDSIDDCGGCIIDAKECFEYMASEFESYKSSLKEEIEGKKVDISLRKRVDNPDDAMLNDSYNMAIDHILKLID